MEEKVICPICYSAKNKLFGRKNNYDLWSCQECGLLFVWPVPRNLREIYSQDYFLSAAKNSNFGYTNYDEDKESMRDTFIGIIKKLEKMSLGRKIFDVGAATGYFLDLAKNRGWQTAGTEISDYAAGVAASRGHQVVCREIDQLTVTEQFNVITMWDVLEHVAEPLNYLAKANELLVPGGLLAINTVNRASLIARILGLNWHLIVPPEHLNFYSRKNLEMILKRASFEVIDVSTMGKKFSLSYIFKTLYSWQGLKIFHWLAEAFDRPFWRRLAIPINLRDNIYILAQKK